MMRVQLSSFWSASSTAALCWISPFYKTGMFARVVLALRSVLDGPTPSSTIRLPTSPFSWAQLQNQYPWSTLPCLSSQRSPPVRLPMTMIMVLIGMALNLPVYIIIAGWVACNANYMIPPPLKCRRHRL